MVMGRRPEVKTASASAAAFAVAGLAAQLATALVSVPFRRPWKGPAGRLHNVGMAVTRTVLRAFIGYATSLPIREFRSVEILIDGICRVVLPPFLKGPGVTVRDADLGGVPVLEYRPRHGAPRGAILYLHGGGFIGTSPSMYAALLAAGLPAERLFVAGDSGGGNLATTLLVDGPGRHLPRPAGLILFSPELSLALDEPSITENADRDILPWNIPVRPYLHGLEPRDERVSAVDADLRRFPPTFVAFGGDEMFRDPIRRFVDRLERSGVDTTAIEEPDMFHVFPILMPWAHASGRVYRAVGAFVRERLGSGAPEGAKAGHR